MLCHASRAAGEGTATGNLAEAKNDTITSLVDSIIKTGIERRASDIHIEPYIEDKIGVNSLVVRKKKWLNLLMEAKAEGYLTLDEITADTLNSSQKMAYKKKGRNGQFVNLNKMMERVVPQYDVDYLNKPTVKTFLDYAQNRGQQFLGRHKSLWWLVSILKKDTSKLK